VCAAARKASPRLPILWGGAHAALAPRSCLATGVVDGCVPGAGEGVLSATVAALRARRSLAGVPGLDRTGDLSERPAAETPPLPDLVPRVDYGLLDVERHFVARGGRRLDYCSSRGSRPPEDGWTALPADRVVAEVEELGQRHRLTEVLFQDEDFFADTLRAGTIARGLLEGGGRLGWRAAASVDDVLAWTPDALRLLAESGCRRLVLAVAPTTALQRDPRERLLETAHRLRTAGLPARFAFEVGEQSREDLEAIIGLARKLAAIDALFETPIRRARTLEADDALDLDGWIARAEAPWGDVRAERRLARVSFFLDVAQRPQGRRPRHHLLRVLALLRVRLGFFGVGLDRLAARASAVLRTGRPRPQGPGD
jgi:anaerobic magnesium-protoporphyrin IX monomethyl ester cyclase